MTNEQRAQIQRLRSEGKTYAAIAETMDLSCSAVKSFFSRSGRDEKTEKSPETAPAYGDGLCRQCGAPLGLHASNRMKRFCSESCRQKWWKAHPGLYRDQTSTSTCANCGETFKNGGNPKRRFCSRDCYYHHRFGDSHGLREAAHG